VTTEWHRADGTHDASHASDAAFMHRALGLAARGRGGTSPNPMVGALIVSPDGVVVGRGFHERAGTPHAEVHAIADAGDRARGATLYCTLEPCCHTGRTGPCSVAIAQAGIRRVVAAVTDPNPKVASGGVRYLREHGIDVTVGVLGERAARLNEVFFTNVTRRRPFVTLKIAMSLDGRIAAGKGERTALTSAAANRHAQRFRAEVDAIGVGSETILVDDPVLTARDVCRKRPLTRVVFDSRLRTPPAARLLTTLDAGPVVIVTSAAQPNIPVADVAGDADAARGIAAATQGASLPAFESRRRALEAAGATIVALDAPHDLRAAMARLHEMGIGSLLLEGGAALHAAAWDADIVDRVRVYVTPHALGASGVAWTMPASFAAPRLGAARTVWLGADCLLESDVNRAAVDAACSAASFLQHGDFSQHGDTCSQG
jgi:diaminohydroxyphosphoribosylaminopyrimidine deaminase/5-amino-6-(5-phosphoribosylamino)uracil reductase